MRVFAPRFSHSLRRHGPAAAPRLALVSRPHSFKTRFQPGDDAFLQPLPSFYDGLPGDLDSNSLCRLSIPDTQTELRAKHVTLREVVDAHVLRRSKLSESYGYFHEPQNVDVLCENSALPGFGIVATVKDLGPYIAGSHTQGSINHESDESKIEHRIGKLLSDAGVTVIGRTSCSEFGVAPNGNNKLVGTVRNPINPQLTTGGSSGGNAGAVAASVGHVSIANDTGGSIHIPASFCGCVGIRPQASLRLNGEGVRMFGANLTAAGPISRDVTDAAIVLDILATPPSSVRTLRNECEHISEDSIHSWTIGHLPSTRWFCVDHQVDGVFRRAISRLQQSSPASFVGLDAKACAEDEPFYPHSSPVDDVRTWWLRNALDKLERERPRIDNLSAELRDIAAGAESITDLEHAAAMSRLGTAKEHLAVFFQRHKLTALVTPTVGVLPWSADSVVPPVCLDGTDKKFHVGWNAFTYPTNFADLASGTLNCGWARVDRFSLPVGMHVIVADTGDPYGNLRQLVRIMRHLELNILSQTTERGFPRFDIRGT